MAVNHDVFENGVADGDTISDGWINGCYDAMKNITTGHDHDGVDSKKVEASNVNGLDTYGAFNTSTGHDHDGTDSKKVPAGTIMCDVMTTDTATYTESSNGWVAKKTYTFTPPSSNNIILGVEFICDIKTNVGGGAYGMVQATFGGASGTFYIASSLKGGTYDIPIVGQNDATGYITYTAKCLAAKASSPSDSTSSGANINMCSDEASYNIIMYAACDSGGETMSVTNIIIKIWYVDSPIVTTGSAKFS